MLVGHANDQTWKSSFESLGCSVDFKSYADATLAALYLDNMDHFPIDLFMKFFNVLLDTRFKLEEITFRNVWDVFDHIATDRRQKTPTQSVGQNGPLHMAKAGSAGAMPCAIPLVVVSLVVDKMVENRLPLGTETIGGPSSLARSPWGPPPQDDWKDVYGANTRDFYQMSLVHRNWLPIVRKGLRRRAVVPYQHVNRFLLSPFCGPWIAEMIIYWTVENDFTGSSLSEKNILFLRGLLNRTPNIRSLCFNTSFNCAPVRSDIHPLYEGAYLQLMSTSLPNLENLWLKHRGLSYYGDANSQAVSQSEHSLSRQISKMNSLKFLSIRSWHGSGWEDADIHPPLALRTMELDDQLHEQSLSWLLRPRGGYKLQSLITVMNIAVLDFHTVELMRHCLANLMELRLCLLSGWGSIDAQTERENVFRICRFIQEGSSRLNRLEFLIMKDDFDFSLIRFPPNLQRIALHFHNKTLRQAFSVPDSEMSFRFLSWLKDRVVALPHLRTLAITGSEYNSNTAWDSLFHKLSYYQDRGYTTAQGEIPEELMEICNEHNIELIYWCEQVFEWGAWSPFIPPPLAEEQNGEENIQHL